MNFGFLIFPGLEELDLVGPWEMISFWSKHAAGPENCLMVAESLAAVVCDKGMSINPHVSFSNCPPLDFLLIPGGQGTRREVDNPVLVKFVASRQNIARQCSRSAPAHSSFTGPVCSPIAKPPPTGPPSIGLGN